MTLNELISVINGSCLNEVDLTKKINSIKTDTRKLEENDIFICIKGKKYDGHNFINEAIRRKVSAIVVSEYMEKNIDVPLIKVDDTTYSLGLLGNYLTHKYNPKVIGITGSNGKTTTKELIYEILKTKYNILKTEKNENNVIGLTHTLFNLNKNHEVVILELGMNHKGEISNLSKICNPDIALITNIGTSHIGLLNGKKNIFKAKLEIIDGMNDGILIVNGDDKYLKKIKKSYKCGTHQNNDLIAYNIYSNNDITSFNIFIDKEYQVRINNPSIHIVNDILLAIKVGLLFDIDMNTILDAINNFKMPEKRMNIMKLNNCTLINDCYNSSFESVIGGLEYLRKIDGKKLIILADMLELGKYSKKYHKKINKYLRYIDDKIVLTVGNYSKYIYGLHFDNNSDLIKYINSLDLDEYYIYVKGSRRTNLDEVIDFIIKERTY